LPFEPLASTQNRTLNPKMLWRITASPLHIGHYNPKYDVMQYPVNRVCDKKEEYLSNSARVKIICILYIFVTQPSRLQNGGGKDVLTDARLGARVTQPHIQEDVFFCYLCGKLVKYSERIRVMTFNFLKSAAGRAAEAMASRCFVAQRVPGEPLNIKKRIESRGGGPEPLPPTHVYPAMPDAVVAVRGVKDNIMAAVREAVIAAGGLEEIQPGQTVMIKPNMCGPAIGGRLPGRITTNPEVLRAVIRLCKERRARIVVGDRSMFCTELAFRTTGFARVCKEEMAEGLPWTRSEYVWFKPGKRHWSRGFRVPKVVMDADHFINVPLLKNHRVYGADFTCCLKALVGLAMPLDRYMEGSDALHTPNISEKVAEINLARKPTINIVDALSIAVRGGPDGLTNNPLWVDADMIIASKDRVACDSVALATLRRFGEEEGVKLPYVDKKVWDQTQIYYGAELGLGQADPTHIRIEDVQAPNFDQIRGAWREESK